MTPVVSKMSSGVVETTGSPGTGKRDAELQFLSTYKENLRSLMH